MTESPPSAPSGPAPSCPEPGAAPRRIAFSLRELMILAVVLALLLIALTPWYQERRTRALVARVRGEMRTVAAAIEAYMIDNMSFPPCGVAEGPMRVLTLTGGMPNRSDLVVIPGGVPTIHSGLPPGSGARRSPTFRIWTDPPVRLSARGARGATPHTLTTPVAYLRAFPPDPFADSRGATFGYLGIGMGWILWSPGPDRDENDPGGPADIGARVERIYSPGRGQPSPALVALMYDPTNGVLSDGDIIRHRQ